MVSDTILEYVFETFVLVRTKMVKVLGFDLECRNKADDNSYINKYKVI